MKYTDSEEWRLITLARHVCRADMAIAGGGKSFLDRWAAKHGNAEAERLRAEARRQWLLRDKWQDNLGWREDDESSSVDRVTKEA